MNEHEFDPGAALEALDAPAPSEPPAAAAGPPAETTPGTPAAPPTHAQAMESRRDAALAKVAEYRAAHPGDPRTDQQLLVCPYGGYELLGRDPAYHPLCMERLAQGRPAAKPEEAPR